MISLSKANYAKSKVDKINKSCSFVKLFLKCPEKGFYCSYKG